MTRIGSSDLDVFPLNLGGNVFGWSADRDASFAILDAFVNGGGTIVDTADAYSAWVPGHVGGESETILGEWLASRGRDRLLVATKVGRHPELMGLSADNVARAAEASLRRLQADHIDLYYAHFDDPEVPIAEIAGAFSELVDAGKVRYVAISNLSPDRIDAWFDAVAADGLHAPVALQPHYNLLERDVETNGYLDVARKHGMTMLPYNGLARGFLTGKYRDGEVTSVRSTQVSAYRNERGERVVSALDEVASAHHTALATVALAWLREQGTIPISSVSRVSQLPDLLASATLHLSTEEINHLTAAGNR